MRESRLERKFVDACKKRGAWPLKLIAAGIAGLPDRMILISPGRVVFAEMKRLGEVPRALQLKRHEQLRAFGFSVWTIDSHDKIKIFIEEALQ